MNAIPDILALSFRRALLLVLLASLAGASMAQGPRVEPRARAEHVGDGPRIWWNMKPYIDALALTGEQRAKMDEIFEAHRAARREQGQAYGEENRAFAEALAQGNFDEARKVSARMSAQTAELAELANQLKIDVIRLLTGEQRAKLAELPAVLRRPWVMGGVQGGGAMNRREMRQGMRPGGEP